MIVHPGALLDVVMDMITGTIANINDDEQRAKCIRMACELECEMALGVGAELACPKDEMLERHIQMTTDEVNEMRPRYEAYHKAANARNN